MAIPDFQTLMLPVLKLFADGKERNHNDVRGPIAAEFQLSDSELATLLPSGRQSTFANRVSWALGYLKQARLLESVKRGIYRVTPRGQDVLKAPPPSIDIAFLDQYPEFVEFRTPSAPMDIATIDPNLLKLLTEGIPVSIDAPMSLLTPDEQVRTGAARIRENLAAQLLERVKRGSPEAFEHLVIDVLVAMGYGGSQEDAAQVLGKSGDGGIDGIIKEDRLGLDNIYVQAKRWDDAKIGRPAIQQFAGALQGQNARKGVFITTSSFTQEAIDCAKGLQTNIVLINGIQLADYMIDFGVGVSDVETIHIKRLDEDYFGEV